jgi:tocopherol cyclase
VPTTGSSRGGLARAAKAALLRSSLWHPERYHGHGRRPPFFEGWYYKLVDRTETARHAVIPGVFTSEDPRRAHAFVQVLDGSTGSAVYHRFPVEAFEAARDTFDVRVGPNRFTTGGLELDLDQDGHRVRGAVSLGALTPWPVTLTSPGIMGPYAFVPWMECNHGVVSLDHELDGAFAIDGREVSFAGGRGYLEKDWGAAFPAGYVWMQSNHFATPGTSLVASIAVVPWRSGAFPGFIIGLWHRGRLVRFATYNGARTTDLAIDDATVRWTVTTGRLELRLRARRAEGGLLHGPTREDMASRVGETMRARVEVRLRDLARGRELAGEGHNAGLEVHGDLDALLALQVASS